GDTGTNMLLTMRSAMEESYRAPDGSASNIGAALAHGALMGARGNSGVILSQVFRGLAQELQGRDSLCSADLARALKVASEQAYKGVAKPAEGTMLTVIRDAADAAGPAASADDATILKVLEAAVEAARDSVARTPTLLPALREAGVVDAGGQGVFVLLEGALHYIRGDLDKFQFKKPEIVPSAIPLALRVGHLSAEREEPYGYCTEFIIEGQRLSDKRVMSYLNKKGQSVVVVGDEHMLKVHVHTFDPGLVMRYALSKGVLHQIKIENMDDQSKEFFAARKAESGTGDIAVVAVVSGTGLEEVFRSLGVARVVHGGQTMNPSVRDILKAVDGVAASQVIVLPNNKNVVQSANRVPALTSKTTVVVPTESIPQGVSALLSFNFEQDLEQNIENMKRAAQGVKTIEISKAVRSTRVDGMEIKKGQAIGILNDKIVSAGSRVETVLIETLARAGMDSAEMVTLYYGAGIGLEEAERAKSSLASIYPSTQFEVVSGDQAHYCYIGSVE
ncbi:MAG: DAK2 domain-containing protein, partial [Dehalococcoidia bacterium]|nr:DAK2 domain-containing protein [Dehalococcoidia bacterium]